MDVLGLVIAANTHDNAAGIALLGQVAEHASGTVEKALGDQGCKKQVLLHGAGLGIDVEIVQRRRTGASCLSRSGGGSSRPTGS